MAKYHHVDYAGTGYMGVTKSKEKNRIPKIPLTFVPTSENFGGDILLYDQDQIIERNDEMEEYAMRILIIYYNYKSLDDLMIEGSYVRKFLEWTRSDQFTDKIHTTLGNFQNMKNMKNLSRQPDALAKETTAFISLDTTSKKRDDEDDEDIPKEFMENLLADFVAPHSYSTTNNNTGTSTMDMSFVLDRGKNLCGSRNIAMPIVDSIQIENTSEPNPNQFLGFITRQVDSVPVTSNRTTHWDRQRGINIEDISCLIGTRVERRVRSNTTEEHVVVEIIANGTAESIVKWARHNLTFDKEQQRAFEIIIAKFVLTYYDEAQNNPERAQRTRDSSFAHERKQLEKMAGQSHLDQLIMFLTGPGGSGKSEIVNGVLLYAKEYCSNLEVPFTEKTILITACSGVAATLINGETVHRAVHLNVELKNLTATHIEQFEEVRLLIIDEISFMASDEIRKLDEVLRRVRERLSKKYGGLDIVFMGDFSQIPPIKGTKVYEDNRLPQWHEWMNCFIQLKGRWRFKDDPKFGEVCWRFHEGTPTPDDFDFVNSRLLSSKFQYQNDL